MIGELRRLEYRSAAEVCARYTPSDAARALLVDRISSEDFLGALDSAGLTADASEFLAHALPKREVVWWACLCVRESLNTNAAPAPLIEAIAAAEKWASSPGDINRRKAMTAAEAAGLDQPAGCVALAAHLSGGSLAPPGLPEVKPAEHLTATVAGLAIKVAALQAGPDTAPIRQRRFLDLGIDVARAANRWSDPL